MTVIGDNVTSKQSSEVTIEEPQSTSWAKYTPKMLKTPKSAILKTGNN